MLNNSSICAISRKNISHFNHRRNLWRLIFAACLIGSICKIYRFYSLYRQYPVVVHLQVIHERNLEFPAVSICNLNRIKTVEPPRPKNCPPGIECATKSGSRHIIISENGLVFRMKPTSSTDTQNKRNKEYVEFLRWYYNESEMKRSMRGHQLSDILIGCSFNGRDCSEAHISNFTNIRFGNCLTFNKRTEGNEPLKVSQTGVDSGLTLKLRLETARYHPTTLTIGVRMIIHDPYSLPSAEEDSYFIGPGYENLVSLRQTVIKRLPAPYKDECFDYKNQATTLAANSDECIRIFIQNENFEKCGCIDQTLAVMNNLKACNLMNETESRCLGNVLDEMSRNGSGSGCLLPCRTVYYNEELSKSILPVRNRASLNPTYNPSPEKQQAQNGDLKKKNTKHRQEILRMKIFYSSLDRQVYEQSPQWDITELLSYLGNEIGLWLGLSIAALFYMLEKLAILFKCRI